MASSKKVTFYDHAYTSDDNYFQAEEADPTQIDDQDNEENDQPLYEDNDNYHESSSYAPSIEEDDGNGDDREQNSDDGNDNDERQQVEALEARDLPNYVTLPDRNEIQHMIALADRDDRIAKIVKREVFNLAASLVGCYVQSQGPLKAEQRYHAAYAMYSSLLQNNYRSFRINSFNIFGYLDESVQHLPSIVTTALQDYLRAPLKLTQKDKRSLNAKKNRNAEEIYNDEAAERTWKKGKEIMDTFNSCKAFNSKYGALYTPLRSGENNTGRFFQIRKAVWKDYQSKLKNPDKPFQDHWYPDGWLPYCFMGPPAEVAGDNPMNPYATAIADDDPQEQLSRLAELSSSKPARRLARSVIESGTSKPSDNANKDDKKQSEVIVTHRIDTETTMRDYCVQAIELYKDDPKYSNLVEKAKAKLAEFLFDKINENVPLNSSLSSSTSQVTTTPNIASGNTTSSRVSSFPLSSVAINTPGQQAELTSAAVSRDNHFMSPPVMNINNKRKADSGDSTNSGYKKTTKENQPRNSSTTSDSYINKDRYILSGVPEAVNTFFYENCEAANDKLHGFYGYPACINNEFTEDYKASLSRKIKDWKLPRKEQQHAKVLNSYKLVKFTMFNLKNPDTDFLLDIWLGHIKLIGKFLGMSDQKFGKITIYDKKENKQIFY
jgi:hypothetical protein